MSEASPTLAEIREDYAAPAWVRRVVETVEDARTGADPVDYLAGLEVLAGSLQREAERLDAVFWARMSLCGPGCSDPIGGGA